jgi:hypothetical protein
MEEKMGLKNAIASRKQTGTSRIFKRHHIWSVASAIGLTLCLWNWSVFAQIYTYTKSVKSLKVNAETIKVGMTHDQLLSTLLRTRATAATTDQTVQPDPDLNGSLWIQRYYSTPEGFKFLVEIRRIDFGGPYKVVRIALPEARK